MYKWSINRRDWQSSCFWWCCYSSVPQLSTHGVGGGGPGRQWWGAGGWRGRVTRYSQLYIDKCIPYGERTACVTPPPAPPPPQPPHLFFKLPCHMGSHVHAVLGGFTSLPHRVSAFRNVQPELPLQRGPAGAGRGKTSNRVNYTDLRQM